MIPLKGNIKDYFASKGTVSKWWNPGTNSLNFHYKKELQILDEKFMVDPEWKILDVGTGRGRFAIYFAKKGCEVTALDISEEMLSIAKENAKKEGVADKITFILGDAENLSPFKSEYDVVCCMQTFDHLPNIDKAVHEMNTKIKPKGYFLFTFVPESSFYWTLYWKIFLKKSNEPGEARAYSYNYILRLLQKNNITIKTFFGISIFFPIGPRPLRILLHGLSRFEKAIKPYYSRSFYIKYCTHVLGCATKSK